MTHFTNYGDLERKIENKEPGQRNKWNIKKVKDKGEKSDLEKERRGANVKDINISCVRIERDTMS